MSVTFPDYVKVLLSSFQEAHGVNVARTEMARGVPKQRRTQSDVLVTVTFTVMFISPAGVSDFEDWFYGDAAGGAVWFEWFDPRARVTRQARVVAGSLGELKPLTTWKKGLALRSLKLEYLRSL